MGNLPIPKPVQGLASIISITPAHIISLILEKNAFIRTSPTGVKNTAHTAQTPHPKKIKKSDIFFENTRLIKIKTETPSMPHAIKDSAVEIANRNKTQSKK